MAGLAAAARARELGLPVRLLEKGDRPGGSMLLSSCVIFRYRTFEDFRAECPGGDERLQARVVEELDGAIAWLESLGAPVVSHETGNPRTVGKRFDPRGLTEALVRAAGVDVELGAVPAGDEQPLLLASGGFQGGRELVAEHVTREPLLLRANRWSTGDGLRLGRARGAALSAGMDEFYGRNMPAPPARIDERDYVPLAQLYGRFALPLDDDGREFAPDPPSWAETDLVQATARLPGAQAWYVVDERARGEHVRERTVAAMIEAARTAGATVVPAEELPFPLPDSPKLERPPFTAVRVAAAITHTIGGLRIDADARVLSAEGATVPGLYAAGADAGGISTGGYASGLAAALVYGRIAAETAAAAPPED
jgi:succinate dehydrogenase/fumarate reductase flavoprotein subunit